MDLSSKTMYETFKDQIWKELEPLDPDWFDTLTAQAFTHEGNVSDQDDLGANQEGTFKTPFDKFAVESQLFSTPKVFRQRRVVSPETEDEQSFTAEREKETLPWTATQSPCLFQMSKERVSGATYGGVQPQAQDSFDLLETPQKSPVSYAQHISESLGAQIHHDMSWTSSLNTPPAIASTLILTKPDGSPCPVSLSADRNAVFVRKLFPSLSNASRVGVVSPKNNDVSTVHQEDAVSPLAGDNPEPHDAPQSDCVWRQKLPDAIEDGEIRSTVASVLDGAEDVLSIFFSNSGSALRKVKTDRTKRKQIVPTKDDCSSVDMSTTNSAASSEQRAADQEPGRFPSHSPVKTGDIGITQWSPLSLSEIQTCTVDTSCRDNSPATQVGNSILTEQQQSDFDSGRPVRPSMKLTQSGFTKKKRKFVYTVETLKPHVQREDTQSQKTDSSQGIKDSRLGMNVKQLMKAPDEADCYSLRKKEMQKRGNLTEEKLPPSVQAKVQDFDISQLSRDFAQDFSQMPDPGKLSKVAEDTPRNGFCPSACLSAMKQANQKARKASLYRDCDGVSNRRSVSTTNQNNFTSEGTVSDSGFQSAVATASSFVPPSSENNGECGQWTDFKTDILGATPFPSTNNGNGKAHLDDTLQEPETDTTLSSAVKRRQTLGPGRESEFRMESTSAQLSSSAKGTVDSINCIPFHNAQVHGRLPEKTTVSLPPIHGSGFKTASNKGIQISSANLERAKRLFEETEGGRTVSDQLVRCTHGTKDELGIIRGSVKNAASNQPLSSSDKFVGNGCQLTASQKADVTELCTLLEEADSQFEFTQFKTAKLKQHRQDDTDSPEKADKELDPDFLKDIDFDDSFSSDAEKHMAATVMPDKMAVVSDGKTNCETSSVSSKSSGLSLSSATTKESSPTEDVSPSSKRFCEGSSGNMSAETKNLDRAGHTETSNLESKNPLMLGVGFKTAGGNVLRVSKKCLSKARALFADLEEQLVTSQICPGKQIGETDAQTRHKCSVDSHTSSFLQHKEDHGKMGISDEEKEKSLKNSKMDTAKRQGGFQMASGKEISVSADAMQEAEAFFKDCDVMDAQAGTSVEHKRSIEAVSASVGHKKNPPKCKNAKEMKENFSEEQINEFENVIAGPAPCQTEDVQHNVEIHSIGFKKTPASANAASSHGTSSLNAKALSSLSCTVSKNIGSSAVNESSSSGGFCTASGKKVFISADAMKKAKCLLNDGDTTEDTNEQRKQKEDALRTGHLVSKIQVSPPKTGGFQTAGGKGIAISSAALKKAKSLLSECDETEDKICVKSAHSKMPDPGPRSQGFLAASGKPLAFSSEALQRAKTLFSDISFSAEIPAVSHTKNGEKTQENLKIHCGFSTAGGAKVQVSQKNLLRAKQLLKEFDDGSVSAKTMQEADAFTKDCDVMDEKDGVPVRDREGIVPVSGSGSEKENLSKQDQSVMINVSEEPGHTEFENVTLVHEKMLHSDDVEIHEGVFKSTLDSTDAAPVHGSSSLMAKPSPLCTKSQSVRCSGGFCTGSRQVSVLDDTMTKAMPLLNGNATLEDTKKQLKVNVDTSAPQNSGFQTASGKGVAISSAALTKAKTLLSGCEGIEDKIETPVPGSPLRNLGFLAASGKTVAFSSEALQRAKALFSDISVNAEIPAVSHTRNSEHKDARSDTEKIDCGFTTANRAKVHVSQKNLLKAKNLLGDLADGESHVLNAYSTSPHDTHKSDLSNVKAGDGDMPTKESVPRVVKSLTSFNATETLQNSSGYIFIKDKTPTDAFKFKDGKITQSAVGNLHDSPGEEMSSLLDDEINQTRSSEESTIKRTDESSVLSLNLRGCTEAQQKLVAQEALDCTKALLEDENLAGQRLSATSENVLQQDNPKSSNRPAEEQKGAGKRRVEDAGMSGQPPLKRRLLEEFDRNVCDSRGSTLHPEKSSPNGIMKDRRVFKYSVPLHANITRPHGTGKNNVETRFQKTTPAQYSKKPVFIPPFLKNATTESRKSTVLKDNIRTPSAFVPPFKKQRTIVQESSSKPRDEEDKHHHLVVTPFNSNTFVPPTEKTQSTTDLTGNKRKEDVRAVALADTTNDNLMNNHNLPADCGSEDAAEASRVEDALSRSQDMFQNVQLARDMQDMRIRKKKRQTIRPLPGSLFLTKTSGVLRIPLKAAVNGRHPAKYTKTQLYIQGVLRCVYEVSSETAESFRFSLQQFVQQEALIDRGGVQLADGGWLIPCNDGTAGKEEFYRALCDTPGVDPKLISEEWVYNHYRWIVWKQASMERSFPETMGSMCLTPEQVLLQLKYRYDVEVDHSRRPALRKIMEKDDAAAKTLVLCVCGVVSRGQSPKRRSFSDIKTPGADAKVENPCAVVWLTDGWYAVRAQLDEALTAMLHKGRLAVGGKLIIHGAQLVGSQDACSPLEAPDSLMLKICANSSRPTRWDVKLGFHRDPRPFLLPVSCLYGNGGPVGCVDIVILRSYPIQWMERRPDGGVVFRSVRAEEKEARRYNSHKQKAMEILFAKIQAEFEKEEKGTKPQRRRRTISRQDVANLQDGEELYDAVGDDPAYLEAHLSEQQLETLRTYRRSLMEKQQAELQDRYRRALDNAEDREGSCPKRDVTPVWRLCIADSMEQPGSVYQLNLWRPSSDLQSLLKEGCRYKVYNLTTSDGKKHGGRTTVQLSGTKKTQFQDVQASREWLSTRFQPRVSTDFVDLQNPEFQPLCGEVDLTGYVISVIDGQGFSPAFYLADGKLNFVKVRCFSSLAQSGLEDVVKPHVLLALTNLQLRGQSTSPTPVVYAGDLTVFSTNPKEGHLQESLSQLRNQVQGQENFFLTAEEKLSHLVKSDGLTSISSPALLTRTSASATDRTRDTKTSVTSQQPVRSLGSLTPVSRKTLATNRPTEKDPTSLKRKRALEYLSRIPSPPPLSHLGSVASPCVKKTFNPPRRSGTPSTLKTAQTPARKPVRSPVEDEWVNDEELAMIDTQALLVGDLMQVRDTV
ncbi:breast cancer type 2 susceptibility protein [Chaetodon auriga]|uniref:breast cancer type 2 susceptibility protein n=1 Tax=Chaetodon auriga TaxID=39042 RepID=UPI0040331485